MAKRKLFDIIPPVVKMPGGKPGSYSVLGAGGGINSVSAKPGSTHTFSARYGLLVFFVLAISYFELIYRLWTFENVGLEYVFPVLFTLPSAAVLFLLSVLFSERINKIIAAVITATLTLGYSTQLVYYHIFHAPLSLYSLLGAGDAAQFWEVAFSAILENSIPILLLFIPVMILFFWNRKFSFLRPRPRTFFSILALGILSYTVSILGVQLTRGGDLSQYSLYHNIASPELAVRKLGVLTAMRLDLKRLVFGFEESSDYEGAGVAGGRHEPVKIPASPRTHNMMAVDFEKIMSEENDSILKDMHAYFASSTPTRKNAYTGRFKGNNLIFIIAESFSPHAISKELTPTLYKLSHEGFVFNNFYTPVWGVSTSDGEYVSEMGLLPKSGVWSALKSSANYLPFALGTQFKKRGYVAKAYHDHTYTYYGRDKSIPNLGYDYKGVGNGLNIRRSWPESDLEMMNVTVPEYATSTPFHTYYITVSGHMNYNFYGNVMSAKNKHIVASSSFASYSDPARAYLAANLELEFAMKSLFDQLEAAGTLDDTVIAIVPDNYPHGLPKESLDELAGHTLETNFEIYKSVLIIWKKGMAAIPVDTPTFTLDILPTLSNLFGLEFDSRLLMGHDVFSDASPLVMFLNRSWITDKTRYNSTRGNTQENERDAEYDKMINKIVAEKFKYSAKILETDYYNKVILK